MRAEQREPRLVRDHEGERGEQRGFVPHHQSRVHAREAGMDGHLAKPYTREQLREMLARWL